MLLGHQQWQVDGIVVALLVVRWWWRGGDRTGGRHDGGPREGVCLCNH